MKNLRNFKDVKKIVIKIGTNTLSNEDGSLDFRYIKKIASDISRLENKQIIIVSSGAIGAGCAELGLKGKIRDISLRQVAASVGQSALIENYKNAFNKYNIKVAQILLTYDSFSDRKTYLNLRNSIALLLKKGIIPIINENDSISTMEIDASFGDNDKLSALVASKMEADLLIMLTDIDGLYDKNPENKDAKLIKVVREINKDIEKIAGKAKSIRGLGGMKTKIEAAKIMMSSGSRMIIAQGRTKNILTKIIDGKDIGTIFFPK